MYQILMGFLPRIKNETRNDKIIEKRTFHSKLWFAIYQIFLVDEMFSMVFYMFQLSTIRNLDMIIGEMTRNKIGKILPHAPHSMFFPDDLQKSPQNITKNAIISTLSLV